VLNNTAQNQKEHPSAQSFIAGDANECQANIANKKTRYV